MATCPAILQHSRSTRWQGLTLAHFLAQLERFCGIRGCVVRIKGVFGGVQRRESERRFRVYKEAPGFRLAPRGCSGCVGCFCVSGTAQLEVRSGRG